MGEVTEAKSGDGTLYVYKWGYEAHEKRDDGVAVGIGAALYGYRFDELRLSPTARKAIDEAVRTIQWFEQAVMCRFAETPDELLDLLHPLDRSRNVN